MAPLREEGSLTRALGRDVPPSTRAKGAEYRRDGAVVTLSETDGGIRATVRGTLPYRVQIDRDGNTLIVSCECPYFFDRGYVCKHIWAVLLEAEARGLLKPDLGAGRPEDYRLETADPDDPEGEDATAWPGPSDPEFATPPERHSRTTAEKARDPRPWEKVLNEISEKLAREEAQARPPKFTGAQLAYVIDRGASMAGQSLALDLMSRHQTKQGKWGKPKPAAVSTRDVATLPDPADREIVPLLLGASDVYGTGYAGEFGRSSFRLSGPLLDRVLPLVARTGRAFLRTRRASTRASDWLRPPAPAEELVPLAWDDGEPWTFRLDVIHPAREESFSIDGALVRGADRLLIREPTMVLPSGYVFHAGRIGRLDARGAFALLAQLRGTGPLVIPPDATGQLVDVLARAGVDPSDLPEELRFEIVAEPPIASLSVRADDRGVGAPNLLGLVTFDYGDLELEPGPGLTRFDRERRRLIRRDLAFEEGALKRLAQLGLSRRWDYGQARQLFAIAASQLPMVVRELVAEGWRVQAEGRAFRPAQSMRSEVRSGIDWFELHGTVDFGDGVTAPLPRLLDAVRAGRTTVMLDDGSEGMVPEDWLRRFIGIAGAGEAEGDHVRFRLSQAALLDAALASQPAVRFDERFMLLRDELAAFHGVTALDAAKSFRGQLRDYQREALGWFAFLRQFRFGGCLADDMGLGKTVMVIAWLDRLRATRETNARSPSLVVVPRSVVFNWIEEAARFAPELRVLDFSGAARSVDDVSGYHVLLTTYGTLRRDALRLKDVEFEYVILDEAQAIKNAATAGAKAARLLRARHKLALSGTPVENHLGELWSLFEFLNPGLLGSSSAFARHGLAASRRDPQALEVLARGVRPFILRRTKAQVAPELPQRTELTLRCELQGTQRELYDELRDHYRASLLTRIEREGMQKSRMHVLEALLRLRQAACHPALVNARWRTAPSAKFDALLPQLAEVRDEGHKCLVFSQFTSLLALLRERLDADHVVYEYLDGKTRDREARVRRFQEDPGCGIFLVSLKAGGLGLNLTAAEYVYLLDPWWNPAVEAQAIDRAHRIGQTRHVFAYRLLAGGTVEDKIVELQRTKRDLADAIVRADEGVLRHLTTEDLEVLLS
jgi:superfamily II DNA or RNA helicase